MTTAREHLDRVNPDDQHVIDEWKPLVDALAYLLAREAEREDTPPSDPAPAVYESYAHAPGVRSVTPPPAPVDVEPGAGAVVRDVLERWDGYGHGPYCTHLEPQLPCQTCALMADLRDALSLVSAPTPDAPPAPAAPSEPRELHCEDCDRDYAVWYADNDLWNAVMRPAGEKAGEPFLCPTCFLLRARDVEGCARVTWCPSPGASSPGSDAVQVPQAVAWGYVDCHQEPNPGNWFVYAREEDVEDQKLSTDGPTVPLVPAPDVAAALTLAEQRGYERGKREERAAVVAWLDDVDVATEVALGGVDYVSDAIKRGYHLPPFESVT